MPFKEAFECEGDEGEGRQKGRNGEGRRRIVFVVENLNMQWQGIGQPPDMARDHRNRAKFTHRSRIAKNHPIKETPADIGQGDVPEDLPSGGP